MVTGALSTAASTRAETVAAKNFFLDPSLTLPSTAIRAHSESRSHPAARRRATVDPDNLTTR
jgi:hypothetical protein